MRARARVLLLDDNAGQTEAMRSGPRLRGIEADVYNDPFEAVENFRAGQYDLVVVDVAMPGMNDFQVLRALRRADKDVRVCLLSGFEIRSREFSRLFPDALVQRILKKPVALGELVSEVGRLVSSEARPAPGSVRP